MPKQFSLKYPVPHDGVNIYNGRPNSATIHPLEEDIGIIFRYRGEVEASLDNARHALWGIGLENGKTSVYLCEHMLSPMYALGIDNALIELSDGVCPTTDNCSEELFHALREARVGQAAERRYWRYSREDESIIPHPRKGMPDYLIIKPSDSFVIDYQAYYPHKVVGPQEYRFEFSEETYERDIAAARSPAFLRNRLLARGFLWIGRMGFHGINERNYLLIASKKDEEYLNPPGFGARYGGEEFVRHKPLDVLGTLPLTGRQFRETELLFHMTGHDFDIYALKRAFEMGHFTD